MTPKQAARIAERDKQMAELCANFPLMTIDEMADRMLIHKTTLQVALRRLGINRKVGRRPKVR